MAAKEGVNLKCPRMLVGKKDFNIFKMKGFFFCVVKEFKKSTDGGGGGKGCLKKGKERKWRPLYHSSSSEESIKVSLVS